MVAACALLREDGATRVGILDYDMHYGDGTEDILDEIVFRELSALGIPVAWDLAGGYQKEADGGIPKVLEIHTNTALAALVVT